MGKLYGREPFRPGLILSQIAAMQILFWCSFSLFSFTGTTLIGSNWSFIDCFIADNVNVSSGYGWIFIVSLLATGFVAAGAVALIVQRMKRSLDFVFTAYFIHFLSTWGTAGSVPTNGEWWIVSAVSFLVAAALGEYLCLRKEMQDISVDDIVKKRARAEERLQREAEAEKKREADNMRQRNARVRSTAGNNFVTPPSSPPRFHQMESKQQEISTTESKKPRPKRGESFSLNNWNMHGDWFTSLRGIFKNTQYSQLRADTTAVSETPTPIATPSYMGWRSSNLGIIDDAPLPEPAVPAPNAAATPLNRTTDHFVPLAKGAPVPPFTPFNMETSNPTPKNTIAPAPAAQHIPPSPASTVPSVPDSAKYMSDSYIPAFGHLFRSSAASAVGSQAFFSSPRTKEQQAMATNNDRESGRSVAASSTSFGLLPKITSRGSMASTESTGALRSLLETDEIVLDMPNFSGRSTSGGAAANSPVQEPAPAFAVPSSTTPGTGILYRRVPPPSTRKSTAVTPAAHHETIFEHEESPAPRT